jgi:predicted ribosome quality control (RQC) complex YloA/Tae2 family protein
MKKAMSNVDVAAIVSELGERLMDARVGKAYQQSADTVWLALQSKRAGKLNLLLEAGRRVHITGIERSASKMPPQFPLILRKYLTGGRIHEISQHDFDRVIEISVEGGKARYSLIAELFPKGNIVLLDESQRIILPLRPMVLRGRRTLAGDEYQYHGGQPDPREISKEDLSKLLGESEADLVRTLVRNLNMGGVYGEEVCRRAGIEKNKPAREVDSNEIDLLFCELSKVFDIRDPMPQIVYQDDEPLDVIPAPLLVYSGLKRREFESFSEALDAYFVDKVPAFKPTVLDRRLEMQKRSIEDFRSREQEYIRAGELIYESYATIDELLGTISGARSKGYTYLEIWNKIQMSKLPVARQIRSIDHTGEIRFLLDGAELMLNAELTTPGNAQRYYERAKEMAKKRAGAEKAIEDTQRLIEKKTSPKPRSRLLMRPKKPRWYERFRWFESTDGFLIIGGRDAQTNEELYSKYLENRDLVFHTDAPGAPLTIVKTSGEAVPESTLEEAAQFAVSYSSVWKAGMYAGDCYMVRADQVTRTPEHGEFLRKGSFVIRGERRYFRDVPVGVSVGITDERLIGGPPSAIKPKVQRGVDILPGEYSAEDLAKRIYRLFAGHVEDKRYLKGVASPEQIARFLPPGGSRISE